MRDPFPNPLPPEYRMLSQAPGYYDEDLKQSVMAEPGDEVIASLDTLVGEAPEGGGDTAGTGSGSRAWLIHKTAKQALWRPAFAAAFLPRANLMYRTYTSRFAINPNDQIFNDTMTMIYRPQNITTRMLKRMFVPAKYRQAELTKTQAEALRTSGAAQGKVMSRLMIGANVMRLAGNGAAIADCVAGQGCSAAEAAVIGSDTASTISFIGVQRFYAKGFEHIKSAQRALDAGNEAAHMSRQVSALKTFDIGKRVSYASFGLQAVGGGIKVGIELHNYSQDPESARFSALVDGAVDIGQGAAYSYYNYYLVSRAGNIAKIGSLIGVKKATDVLSANAMVIPGRILWPMRCLGVAGGVLGFIPNAVMFHNGMSETSLPLTLRRRQMISGSLGMAGSAFFIAGTFFITPASLPLGVIFLGIGMALIAAQTIYDEWDDLGEMVRGYDEPEMFENTRLYIEPPDEMPAIPARRHAALIPMTPVN